MPKHSEIKLVSKKLADEPIQLPGNPFWLVFKRFGRDEGIAMVINVVGTAILSLFTVSKFLLSIIGPIVEKIGFFPAHIKEAWDIYRTTPPKQRKHFVYYLRQSMKGALTSLVEDILVHDPLYILFMFVGLTIYAATPPWLLSAVSFVVAVLIVSVLEVAFIELQYWRFKRRMFKYKFELETYFESRFFISSKCDPDTAIKQLAKRFDLGSKKTLHYEDIYLDSTLSEYSGRTPKIRLRKRTSDSGPGYIQTAQIVYTKPSELSRKKLEQCRYFPIKKEKLYALLNQTMPWKVENVKDDKIRVALKKSVDKKTTHHKVRFKRTVTRNDKLLISVDRVRVKRPFYLLELKTHTNTRLLMRAMRYVMRELPVVQTTHGKYDLTCEGE